MFIQQQTSEEAQSVLLRQTRLMRKDTQYSTGKPILSQVQQQCTKVTTSHQTAQYPTFSTEERRDHSISPFLPGSFQHRACLG